jgi:hypothetical protein
VGKLGWANGTNDRCASDVSRRSPGQVPLDRHQPLPPAERTGPELSAQFEEWGLDLNVTRDGVEIRKYGTLVHWLDANAFLELYWLDSAALHKALIGWSGA